LGCIETDPHRKGYLSTAHTSNVIPHAALPARSMNSLLAMRKFRAPVNKFPAASG
jgi:hypothetical protein